MSPFQIQVCENFQDAIELGPRSGARMVLWSEYCRCTAIRSGSWRQNLALLTVAKLSQKSTLKINFHSI